MLYLVHHVCAWELNTHEPILALKTSANTINQFRRVAEFGRPENIVVEMREAKPKSIATKRGMKYRVVAVLCPPETKSGTINGRVVQARSDQTKRRAVVNFARRLGYT